MKLIVQLPALNESRTIAQVIGAIPRPIEGVDEIQVVVIDDGSTDDTGALARAAGAHVLRHEQPRGVGMAFRTGIEYAIAANADVVVTIDADGQFDPADIPLVIGPVVRGEADFVTASRFKDPALEPDMPRSKRWGNDFMARWISSLVKQEFRDVSCGFRAYGRNAYLRLVLLGEYTYTHETFLALAYAGVRIAEVPARVRGTREHGTSRVASNLFRYGWRTALIILRTYRDYKPLRFFGMLATWCFGIALVFLAFLMSVRWGTGKFTPHKWAGFVSLAFGALGTALFMMGTVAEMLDRMRVAQQETLFRVRQLEQRLKK
jgi:glycosyltransferase involved in cell wall biosynthesis